MLTVASTYKSWDGPLRVNGLFNIDLRTHNWKEALKSKEAAKSYIARCKEDIVFWANNNVDTYNPQEVKNKNRPMLLCLRQEECLEHTLMCEKEGLDSVYPKTRRVGESWLLGAVYPNHRWHFEEGWAGLMGSRTKELVEAGDNDMDTLFAKFDFVERNLFSLVKIKEYGQQKPYKVELLRKNPLNGAQLKGEAITEDFGAGPRASYIVIDEASKARFAKEGWYSAGQTSQSKHAIGTPKGKEFFWSLNFPDQAEKEWGSPRLPRPRRFRISYKDIPWFNQFFIFDIEASRDRQWRNIEDFRNFMASNKDRIIYEGNGYSPLDYLGTEPDPKCLADHLPYGMGYDDGKGNFTHLQERRPLETMPKNGVSVVYPWREIEGLKYDEAYAGRELDISFEQSRSGLVYAVQMDAAPKKPEIKRNPNYPLYGLCDPGGSKGNEFYLAFTQWNWELRMYEFLREIAFEGRSAFYPLAILTGNQELLHYAEEEKIQPEYRDLFAEFLDPIWRVNRVYADPAINSKTASSRDSIKGVWNKHGINVRIDYAWTTFAARIPAARRLLKYSVFDTRHVSKLINGLSSIYYADEDINSTAITAKNGYVHHPIFSHPCAAYEYFSCGDPHRWDNKDANTDSPENRIMTAEDFTRKRPLHAYDKMGRAGEGLWTPSVEGSGW